MTSLDDSRAFVSPPRGDGVRVIHEGGDPQSASKSAAFDPFRPEGALDSSAVQNGSGLEYSAKVADSQEASAAAALDNPLAQAPGSGVYSGTFRRESGKRQSQDGDGQASLRRGTMQSLRKSSSGVERKASGVERKSTFAPGTLGKRSTLASMMLSTKYTNPGAETFDDEAGDQVQSERGSTEEQEIVNDGEEEEETYGTAERLEAEQIFMPNMRREAYVPLRIARDKLKQVLKEMAQMKHMHYAALETMERQQEFLKAQMEATVATYARKLTGDYNDRVKALEAEYQRRLDGMNKTALGDLQATLAAAQRDAKNLEQRMQAQLHEKDQEIEKERNLFQTKVQMARQALADSDKAVASLKNELTERDNLIEQLNIDLRVAKASGGDGGGGVDSEVLTSLQRQVENLKSTVNDLRRERDELLEERAAFEKALEERDHEIAQLQDQLANAEGGGGDLVVGGDDEGEYEGGQEEDGVVIGGDEEEEGAAAEEEPTELQL